MAFLVLLESLSPIERAVFLLREVFQFGYDEIADTVGKSKVNCRQIFVRARRHIDAGRPRLTPQPKSAREFFAAAERGDFDGLVRLTCIGCRPSRFVANASPPWKKWRLTAASPFFVKP